MTQQTKLSIQSASISVPSQMEVQGLVGVRQPTLVLRSPDGKWALTVPRDLFPPFQPGENAIVSITLTRAAVEAVEEGPQLILPGRAN